MATGGPARSARLVASGGAWADRRRAAGPVGRFVLIARRTRLSPVGPRSLRGRVIRHAFDWRAGHGGEVPHDDPGTNAPGERTGLVDGRYGGRTMWTACVVVFLAGSVLCGVAWSAQSLIVFRVIQGLGGGMILPLGMAVLAQAAGPSRLGPVMGVMGVPAALAPVLGPALGGVIISDLGWRWIFFVNVPVCLAAMLVAWRVMPSATATRGARLDIVGVLLLSPACAIVVYGLTGAGRFATFTDPHAFIPLIVGAVLLVAFAIHALRTHAEPILDLRLLRIRSFAASSLVLFMGSVALFGAASLLPLYYQQARGHSVLHTGLLLIPQGVGMGASLFLAGRFTERTGPRLLVLTGLALTSAGTLVFIQLGPHTSEVLLGAALAVSGAGVGTVMAPAMAAAIKDIVPAAIPRASAANRVIMQLGASFGSAVVMIVLQGPLNGLLGPGRPDPAALADAYAATFWWILAFTATAILIALAMPGRKPGRRSTDTQVPITVKETTA
ncbi:DHA2 family efflux MFS transporter permease subunit [Spirillospora sp. CA-128828]|uniref:DHA2 family efflux MFS transporter permease subunit n=1 Tax=Spirillospora sp. CA-128828 TaxID=3240033 RepID=UPI003D8C3DBF